MKITYWPTKKQQQQKEISTKTPSNLNIISLSNPNMKFITPKDWDSKTEIIRKLFLDSQTKLHIKISQEHNSSSPKSLLMKPTKRKQTKDNKMTTPTIITKEMKSQMPLLAKPSDNKENFANIMMPTKMIKTQTRKQPTPYMMMTTTQPIFVYR